jgi:hypothetical protein
MIDKKMVIKIIKALSFTLFIFGLAGWIYIAENAWFHPQTLPLPLTHLLPFPREDTFGTICFGTAFLAFFVWNLIRYTEDKK